MPALDLGHLRALDGVPAAKQDITIPELVDQLIANFLVEKFQRTRPLVDHGHVHPEGCEHRGVFNPNDARPDHGHGARELGQGQDIV